MDGLKRITNNELKKVRPDLFKDAQALILGEYLR